jgi:phosphoketolase
MALKILDIETQTLPSELLHKMNPYWRTANYISVGLIYLCDIPLLEDSLKPEHIKAALLGHWGSTPKVAYLKQDMQDKLIEHKNYIQANGMNKPEIRNWRWKIQ